MYKIVRKLTGSIGGNGYCGPIYGELTMGSMEKMIDMMIEYTSFNKSSRFIKPGNKSFKKLISKMKKGVTIYLP